MNVKQRLEALERRTAAILRTWKPCSIIASGNETDGYKVRVAEWDGVNGSIHGDERTEVFMFGTQNGALEFMRSFEKQCAEKYGKAPAAIDCTFPLQPTALATVEEYLERTKKQWYMNT